MLEWNPRGVDVSSFVGTLFFCWDACRNFFFLSPLNHFLLLPSKAPRDTSEEVRHHVERWGRCWWKPCDFWEAFSTGCRGDRAFHRNFTNQATPSMNNKHDNSVMCSCALISLPWAELYYKSIGFLQRGQKLHVWDWRNNKLNLEKNFPHYMIFFSSGTLVSMIGAAVLMPYFPLNVASVLAWIQQVQCPVTYLLVPWATPLTPSLILQGNMTIL